VQFEHAMTSQIIGKKYMSEWDMPPDSLPMPADNDGRWELVSVVLHPRGFVLYFWKRQKF
jgi:hypothetical protein